MALIKPCAAFILQCKEIIILVIVPCNACVEALVDLNNSSIPFKSNNFFLYFLLLGDIYIYNLGQV